MESQVHSEPQDEVRRTDLGRHWQQKTNNQKLLIHFLLLFDFLHLPTLPTKKVDIQRVKLGYVLKILFLQFFGILVLSEVMYVNI